MKQGFYDKLESELQGFQNTYYVGGLMAFELTERNAAYCIDMVFKHFANDDDMNKFPYFKVNEYAGWPTQSSILIFLMHELKQKISSRGCSH